MCQLHNISHHLNSDICSESYIYVVGACQEAVSQFQLKREEGVVVLEKKKMKCVIF